MKKFLLLIILSLLFSLTAFAQGVKLGVRAGLNVANISFDPNLSSSNPSTSNRRFFLAGGILQIGISELFAVGAEPTYIQKGGNLEYTLYQYGGYPNLTAKSIIRYRYSYFELPVLFKVYLPFSAVKPFAEIGMAVGFRLASSKVYDFISPLPLSIFKVNSSVNQNSAYSYEISNKENTAFTEFGFALGAGVEIPILSIVSLQIDARYAPGTSDIQNNPVLIDNNGHSIRTTDIQFSAGVLFNL